MSIETRKKIIRRAVEEALRIEDETTRFARLFELVHRLDHEDTPEVVDHLLSILDSAPEHLARHNPARELYRYRCRAMATRLTHATTPEQQQAAAAEAEAAIEAVPEEMADVRAEMFAFLFDRLPQ